MGGRRGVSARCDGCKGCSHVGTRPATGMKGAMCGIDGRQPAPRQAARSQPCVPQLPGTLLSGEAEGAGMDMPSDIFVCDMASDWPDAVASAMRTDCTGAAMPGNTSARASVRLRTIRAR